MKSPAHVSLRHIAEELDRHEGYRVEIIGESLMMSPSPRFKHLRVARDVFLQLKDHLPAELEVGWGESVTSPEHGDDYVEPDLMVYPASYEQGEEWSAPGHEVPFVLEVVSEYNVSRDTVQKVAWYATAKVAMYLLIDPREGTWILRSEPVEGEYRMSRHGKFGDDIVVPEPIGVDIATDAFLRYER